MLNGATLAVVGVGTPGEAPVAGLLELVDDRALARRGETAY